MKSFLGFGASHSVIVIIVGSFVTYWGKIATGEDKEGIIFSNDNGDGSFSVAIARLFWIPEDCMASQTVAFGSLCM